jgi:phosphotransferase family enzyme
MIDVNEVADAIGVVLAHRLPHGANAGAHAVRTSDGVDAVLKVVAKEPSEARPESVLVGALRARGYPMPAILRSGTVGKAHYELWELVDGTPMDQPTPAQLPAIRDAIDRQRAIGLGESDWVGHMVTSVTDGCVGYCEHAAMRAHSERTRALLDQLRRVADERRGIEVPTDDAVHYDFSPYNIVVREDRITGVVDWDGARLGDAAFDLVTLAFYTYDAVVRDALIAAARESAPRSAIELYAAHMVLRQVDWSLRHHGPAEVEWFMGIGSALLARVAT